MKLSYSLVSKTAASLLLTGVLAACGGGSSDEAAPVAAVPAPTTFTVAGTAATGAVFANAAVTIITSDGTTYPTTGEGAVVTGVDGSYTITLPLTAKPPFVVKAARDDQSLVSVVAEARDTTTNITPVTNLIASRLSSSGDPAKLADEIKNKTVTVDAAAVKAKVAEIVALIKPLMDAVGDSTDPLNGNIQAAVTAGTGADKVLDSLSISITPSSATTVNIEVSVKQKQAEGEQPVVIAFSGGTGASAPPAALPTVVAADLVPSGNATMIADLLQRIQACYAVPLADRIASGGKTAADIVSPACRTIFSGDDPANYKSGGAIVSATGAWSSIFSGINLPDTKGIRFDNGSYEFTRANGDLVIAFRSLSSLDAVTYSTAVVRTEGGKLKLIGNQYKYNGGVNAYQQLRNFINQPAADNYSTGYTLNVNNTADVADVAKVVVTSPKGNTLVLMPTAASSYFPLVKADTTISGTNFVRLARQYLDTANTGDPALADTGVFFSTDRYTAADILAIPAQAKWKFDYYLKSAPTVIDATQYFTTRARAMTIAELQAQPLANMVDELYASTKAEQTVTTTAAGTLTYYVAANPADPEQNKFDWVVPTGALEPTSIQVYGNYLPTGATTRSQFNDRIGVKSTARTGTITCSGGGSDTHCDSAGKYVANARFNGVHLWAQDATGREFAHFYAVYTVIIP